MSHHEPTTSNPTTQDCGDGAADAFATVAIMILVIGAVVYWLHGMPM